MNVCSKDRRIIEAIDVTSLRTCLSLCTDACEFINFNKKSGKACFVGTGW
jgi:hypothetical protein